MNTKTKAKEKKVFIDTIASLAIVLIILCSACLSGCNVDAIIDKLFQSNNDPTPSTSDKGKIDPDIPETPDSGDIIEKSAIELNIINNTCYTDFIYTFALYTHEDEDPVVKLNGTATLNKEEFYLSLTYEIDEETYDSLVGLGINVENNKDDIYIFSNDYSAFNEEDVPAVESIIESISEATPDKVVEQTYEEQLHDVVTCLRKKNNRVTVTDIKYIRKEYNDIFFSGKVYIEADYQDGEKYALKEYEFSIKQLKSDVIILDNGGKTEYHFNTEKGYMMGINTSKYNEYEIDDSEYINMYVKSKESDSKNSKRLEIKLAKTISYRDEYEQYEESLER